MRGSNSSFLTLIPKIASPRQLTHYRPISMIGSMYKVLSKLLAKRLSKVLQKLISPTQSRFLPHRNIMEGVLIANELIDEVKRAKSSCLIFKADIEKAFDSVNWDYLFSMMRSLGFGEIWIGWMRECLSTARVAVLFNGSPSNEVTMCRGLCQGDPFSPLLFLIAGEGLNGIIKEAKRHGMINGVKVGKEKVEITNLQYADDTNLVGEASEKEVISMKAVMRIFEIVSGLKVNFAKSRLIGVNVDEEWLSHMADLLNCGKGQIPFKYLGLPVGANPRRCDTWKPVIDSVKKKLKSWSPNLLSFGARLVLVRHVLSSLPTYFFSLFKAPKAIINQITSLQRNFL